MSRAVVVVDVGNTRVKWGLCRAGRVVEVAALPSDDADAWRRQHDAWRLGTDTTWALSGVHPGRRDVLRAWLEGQGAAVRVLASVRDLPLTVALPEPDKVGIDRLLDAVAANRRREAGTAAAIIDAGSAVTVDYVDERGVFRGGAIFPGLRLMAQALHEHTALLPVVAVSRAEPPPGDSTTTAIRTGVYHAVLGGAERLVAAYRRQTPGPLEVYLTGGDAPLLAERFAPPFVLWPEMTLEGILHSLPPGIVDG